MPSAVDTLEALRPSGKANVMALLMAAGHNVDHWGWNADGSQVAKPAANPNYCYDWSFGTEATGLVLCVWHGSIKPVNHLLIYTENMRALDNKLSAVASSTTRVLRDRDRARQQATRARAFDALVRIAFEKLLPIRFIVNEGARASAEQLGAESSKVSRRALDVESWYVHEYNEQTGDCSIVRGVKPARDLGEQGNGSDSDEYLGPEDKRQLKAIEVRRGQRDFRDRLLAAWKRRCVVTECRIEGLLEAAHIAPHAETGDYRTSNGLLLRADIHTLYDLGLLSIDQDMTVHLAPPLTMSDYRQYNGKRIDRRPDSGVEAPSRDALSARHAKFSRSGK